VSAGQLARVALLLAAAVPVKAWSRLPVLCPSRWIGQRCPGCGITRALGLLLHGRPREALATNPRVVLVAPLLLWLALQQPAKLGPQTEIG
jgi:hypothetical protein